MALHQWPRKRLGEAEVGSHDPGERMFWEQRGHDLKKPKAYFSSKRGQAVPVKKAASGGGKEPEKTRNLTPLHLLCINHGGSLPIFKAPCPIFVSTASLATLPYLTLCPHSIQTLFYLAGPSNSQGCSDYFLPPLTPTKWHTPLQTQFLNFLPLIFQYLNVSVIKCFPFSTGPAGIRQPYAGQALLCADITETC